MRRRNYDYETTESLKNKINKAFCPPKQEDGNPLLEYFRYIIFKQTKNVTIERPKKYGGDITFGTYADLRDDYVKGNLHPQDLKASVVWELDKLVKPSRNHFLKNKKAKQLYEAIKKAKITR